MGLSPLDSHSAPTQAEKSGGPPHAFTRAPARRSATEGRRSHASRTSLGMLYAPIAERLDSSSHRESGSAPVLPLRRLRRLPAIDAARGAAMVLVCLSHFATKYVAPAGGDAAGAWLRFISHMASPMFFIISGAMVGYLYTSRPDAFDRVRASLARRALFLLTIGHVLILGAHARHLADLTGSARMLFVTDTIAVALLVSPRLMSIAARWRLLGAATLYVASCAAVYLWDPHGLPLRVVKDTLTGMDGGGFWAYNVPILPWLAVHAAGTVLGAWLAAAAGARDRARIETRLASIGCALVAIALLLRRALVFAAAHGLATGDRSQFTVRQLASTWQRVPPSPTHLLLFGGLALVGISLVFSFEALGVLTRLLDWLGVLGKTSAFVFILQFYVFYVVIPLLVPLHLVLAPAVFLGAMLLIGECARFWLHHRSTLTRRPAWSFGVTSALRTSKS